MSGVYVLDEGIAEYGTVGVYAIKKDAEDMAGLIIGERTFEKFEKIKRKNVTEYSSPHFHIKIEYKAIS